MLRFEAETLEEINEILVNAIEPVEIIVSRQITIPRGCGIISKAGSKIIFKDDNSSSIEFL